MKDTLAVTHLSVYPTGGTPHCHLVTRERYYVLSGQGYVEFLNATQGFCQVSLAPGTYLAFEPGTVHRLVNDDEMIPLQILVIMDHQGLPEAGDAFFPFPLAIISDANQYWSHVHPPSSLSSQQERLQWTLERRDLALKGFSELCTRWRQDSQSLQIFYTQIYNLLLSHQDLASWNAILESSTEQVVQDKMRLSFLDHAISAPGLQASLKAQYAVGIASPHMQGMCGFLQKYRLDEQEMQE